MAELLQTITAILPGSKWSCLLLRIVLQDALSEVVKVHPPTKLKRVDGLIEKRATEGGVKQIDLGSTDVTQVRGHLLEPSCAKLVFRASSGHSGTH